MLPRKIKRILTRQQVALLAAAVLGLAISAIVIDALDISGMIGVIVTAILVAASVLYAYGSWAGRTAVKMENKNVLVRLKSIEKSMEESSERLLRYTSQAEYRLRPEGDLRARLDSIVAELESMRKVIDSIPQPSVEKSSHPSPLGAGNTVESSIAPGRNRFDPSAIQGLTAAKNAGAGVGRIAASVVEDRRRTAYLDWLLAGEASRRQDSHEGPVVGLAGSHSLVPDLDTVCHVVTMDPSALVVPDDAALLVVDARTRVGDTWHGFLDSSSTDRFQSLVRAVREAKSRGVLIVAVSSQGSRGHFIPDLRFWSNVWIDDRGIEVLHEPQWGDGGSVLLNVIRDSISASKEERESK